MELGPSTPALLHRRGRQSPKPSTYEMFRAALPGGCQPSAGAAAAEHLGEFRCRTASYDSTIAAKLLQENCQGRVGTLSAISAPMGLGYPGELRLAVLAQRLGGHTPAQQRKPEPRRAAKIDPADLKGVLDCIDGAGCLPERGRHVTRSNPRQLPNPAKLPPSRSKHDNRRLSCCVTVRAYGNAADQSCMKYGNAV
jgi:hypothetical protein